MVSVLSILGNIFKYLSTNIPYYKHFTLHPSYTLLVQPDQVSVLSKNTFAKVPPHLSPSFPGPSFSDFPPGPPVPARPPHLPSGKLSTQNLSQNVQKYSLTECFYKSFQCSAHIFLCFLANVKRGLLAHAQP